MVSCKARAVIINSPYFLNGLHHAAPVSLLMRICVLCNYFNELCKMRQNRTNYLYPNYS